MEAFCEAAYVGRDLEGRVLGWYDNAGKKCEMIVRNGRLARTLGKRVLKN
jgi:hypothetical protein